MTSELGSAAGFTLVDLDPLSIRTKSKNIFCTLIPDFAEVSTYRQPSFSASLSPSSVETTLSSNLSIIFATRKKGRNCFDCVSTLWKLSIRSNVARDNTEYTRAKAWPSLERNTPISHEDLDMQMKGLTGPKDPAGRRTPLRGSQKIEGKTVGKAQTLTSSVDNFNAARPFVNRNYLFVHITDSWIVVLWDRACSASIPM